MIARGEKRGGAGGVGFRPERVDRTIGGTGGDWMASAIIADGAR